jgi:hypothetical protein
MAVSISRRTTKRASKSGWSFIRRRVFPSLRGTLYDIGFDLPEAHVIRKDKEMYYAFFARNWKAPWSCAAWTIVRITSSTMWTKRLRNRPRSGHAFIRRVYETSFAGKQLRNRLTKICC